MEFDVNAPSVPKRMAAWLEDVWLTRYLDRVLSDDESTWFECYALDKPELLVRIDADNALRDAVAARSRSPQVIETLDTADQKNGAARAESDTQQVANITSVIPTRTGGEWRQSMALAASLFVGVGLGWFSQRSTTPHRDVDVVANPTRLIFDTMRGNAAAARVEHADSQSSYVLIEAAVPPGARSISLKMDSAKAQTLSQSPDGFVSCLVERAALAKAQSISLEYEVGDAHTALSLDVPPVARGPPK